MKDYYQILGIDKNSSLEEIKAAYKKLSKKFHPDLNDGDKFFEEKFKELQNAYDVLIDAKENKTQSYSQNSNTTTSNNKLDEYIDILNKLINQDITDIEKKYPRHYTFKSKDKYYTLFHSLVTGTDFKKGKSICLCFGKSKEEQQSLFSYQSEDHRLNSIFDTIDIKYIKNSI